MSSSRFNYLLISLYPKKENINEGNERENLMILLSFLFCKNVDFIYTFCTFEKVKVYFYFSIKRLVAP